jgi:hypothetical protein
MAEATATPAPSHAVRGLIVKATDDGLELQREVTAFATLARQAGQAFTEEVTPLRLSQRHYDLVADACGLSDLLGMAYRIERWRG